MDLGVFIPIANNGWIISSTSPQYMPTFELNKTICCEAERGGFDFALSMVKFRGYGGPTEYWDYAMDSFALMAGLAEATTCLELYASIASPTMHPAMTARMTASIDDISGGRFGVNIVSGWNKFEYSQMGLWPGDEFYGERYDYSTEYVEVMRALWDKGRVTFHGKYFDLEDCLCQPVPSRRIPILCAGQSPRGMQFAAEVGDYNFVFGDLDHLRQVRRDLDDAGLRAGRQIGAYALFGIIAAETAAEAAELCELYIDGTDDGAIANMNELASNDIKGSTVQMMREKFYERPPITFEEGRAAVVRGACFVIPHLVGSYDQIAEYLDAANIESGMEGVVMTFPDFVDGIATFSRDIQPRMVTRGPVVVKSTQSA